MLYRLKDGVTLEDLKEFGYKYYVDYSNWAKLFYTKIGDWSVEHHIEFIDRIAIQQAWDDDDGHYYNEELQIEEIQDLIDANLVEKVGE